ncbi:hypothetical protein PHMEG_0008867 [Phytophthora megakarya]|uniref:HAT C-terminal dimerisation domain-containing protein n=1 Tax=Phytophthora megakarya TaxID=4795 RepID=A0A225WHX6_9STRA|nr:hypothetical protein PHMEG_0008867 [Phytophthora megakarya]
MLQRSIRLQGALDGFFQHLHSEDGRVEFKDVWNKLSKPKHKEWLAIDCLCALLKPFGTVSTTLGAEEYPTLPLIMSALHAVKASRLDSISRSTCSKSMNHIKPSRVKATREKIVKAVMEMTDTSTAPPTQSSSRATMASPDPGLDRIFGPSEPEAESPTEKSCREEIEKYLYALKLIVLRRDDSQKKDKKPKKFDTLAWWSVNSATYPNISKLARKWLGAVATSVPSERAFSTSRNIITAKRCSLAPELVRDLVFIAENSRRMKKIGQ